MYIQLVVIMYFPLYVCRVGGGLYIYTVEIALFYCSYVTLSH